MSPETVTTSDHPVTLAEVKQYLRVDGSDDDAVLSMLIITACDLIQDLTRQQISTATLRVTLDAFPAGREIKLPRPPFVGNAAVSYFNRDGSFVTLPSGTYTQDTSARPGRIVLNAGSVWPQTDGRAGAVQVEFDAGPTDEKPIKPALKQAILFSIGHWFNQRESVTDRTFTEVPFTVQTILSQNSFPEAIS